MTVGIYRCRRWGVLIVARHYPYSQFPQMDQQATTSASSVWNCPRLLDQNAIQFYHTDMKSVSKTFRLSPDTARALSDLVAWGRATSQAALVEDLVQREALRMRLLQEEERMDQAWREASQDPLFVRDMAAVEADFGPLDAEVWNRS